MADEQAVLYAVEGAVARITLNRPEKRNALNEAVIAGLKESLRRAADDERVRAIVIAGAGKDFCSGADLAALQKISQATVDENVEDAHSLLDLFLLIRQIPVPVVAAVTEGGFGRLARLAFKIRAGQVVKQQIATRPEQVAPSLP